MALLELENVHTYYGIIHALKGLSITVNQAEIVTLIGGNGAGKSTTLKTISGLLHPHPGSILLDGEDLTKYKAHEIVMKGIVQVPEGRQVFNRLTVVENLEMGAFIHNDKKKTQLHLHFSSVTLNNKHQSLSLFFFAFFIRSSMLICAASVERSVIVFHKQLHRWALAQAHIGRCAGANVGFVFLWLAFTDTFVSHFLLLCLRS